MNVKSFIKSANDEYLKIKEAKEKENASLVGVLEKAQGALNEEKERFKAEEEELLSILDATKKERIGEIERVATEKIDILRAEKEKIISQEESRRKNVENAYKDRFEALEREHAQRMEDKGKRYERQKALAKREYEELRLELESSSAVHGDMGAMLANQQNRALLEQIDQLEDKNVELRASIHSELESYSKELTEYLRLKDFTFEPPLKKDILEKAKCYYESLDQLKELQARLQKAEGCDALVEYNRTKLEEAKLDLDKTLKDIDEWYVKELETENRTYISEKNLLEKQRGNSDEEKPELVERIAQIDKEIKEIEEALVTESGKIMEDLSKSEGAKTKMFNMVKADELRKQEELLRQARERLEEFVKEQDQRIGTFLDGVKKELQALIGSGKDFSIGQIRDGKVRKSLPKTITIGGYETELSQCELLERLYGNTALKVTASVGVDVYGGEAVVLSSNNDEYLDRVMGGITLKYLEEFPKGSLSVRIVSAKREIFESIARELDKNEEIKNGKIMSQDPMPALSYADAEANRITQLLGSDYTSAYELYEREKCQAITLLVIRDGIDKILLDGEMLAILRKLLSERGIKAGVRLIIACNDPSELSKLGKGTFVRLENENAFVEDEKISICSIPLQETDFFIKGVISDIESLSDGESNESIGSFFKASKREKNINFSMGGKKRVTYEDLGFDNLPQVADEKIEIPVGLGNEGIATITFDCGEGDYQNTGCLVLGATSTGKSSLLHSIVIEGCKKYSPKDLELWLLDFKRDGAIKCYQESNIPHIKALKQGVDEYELYCYLGCLCEEIEERLSLFQAKGVDNLYEYNKLGNFLPFIVLVVDEMQELFQKEGELVNKIMTRLATTAVKGRCVGVHTVIIANGIGKEASPLVDAYINHIKCKVSFRLSEGALLESHLGEEFWERGQEIYYFQPGQMYISQKQGLTMAKTPYVSSQELEPYFEKIRQAHKEGAPSKKQNFPPQDGLVHLTIGKSQYTGKDVFISYKENNSSLMIMSKKERTRGAILSRLLREISQLKGVRVLCCNGASRFEEYFEPTLNELQGLSVRKYEKTDLVELVKDGYSELVSRRADPQKRETPLFIILNELSALYLTNGKISSNEKKGNSIDQILDMLKNQEMEKSQREYSIGARDALEELAKKGGELGVFVIVSTSNAGEYKDFLSKCHMAIVCRGFTRDELGQAKRGYLTPYLAKISEDEEENWAIFAQDDKIDKIKPYK